MHWVDTIENVRPPSRRGNPGAWAPENSVKWYPNRLRCWGFQAGSMTNSVRFIRVLNEIIHLLFMLIQLIFGETRWDLFDSCLHSILNSG